MSDAAYCYPSDHYVFRNRPSLKDAARHDRFEPSADFKHITKSVPTGTFDLAHLRAIHSHLSQNTYD